jgi:geranylgeranyl diphosphate synthase type II
MMILILLTLLLCTLTLAYNSNSNINNIIRYNRKNIINRSSPSSSLTTSSSRLYATSTKFDLKSYLDTKKDNVEIALDKSLTATTNKVDKIIESMKYSLMAGGKRIRPVLCIASCEMFGGTEAMAMPTAVALEMIHTMSLIHDDLPAMDNDDMRRGKPTNHVLYGEDIAILAGDALLSTSFEHVARETNLKQVSADKVVEVLRRLGTSVGAYGLAGGQVMDLESENKEGVTLEDLEWIHRHKTGALLQVSVAAGAILAGASPEDVKACEIYAEKIGLAFQIADDILDVTATSEELGKTAGKDENVNKTTYIKLLGLEKSKQEAARLVEEAKSAISKYGEKAAPLIGIADYIIARKN